MVTVRSILVSILSGLILSVSLPLAFATNSIYISSTGAGAQSGADCADAKPYSYFNSSANWYSSPAGIQIGPGTTVHGCPETYSDATAGDTALKFQCGTANGNSSSPITLTFDQGATNLYNTKYWSATSGAIGNSGKCSYIVVDGANNLTIANQTSAGSPTNGTGLANQQTSFGISLANCTYCTVRNTTVKNIYANKGSSSNATDTSGDLTACISFTATSTGAVISGNTVSQCKTGIGVSPDGGSPADGSNVTISSNTISDMDWGIQVAGGDSTDTFTGVVIHDNNITNWTNWQFPSNLYHQDGVMLFNFGNPSAGLTATLYNNYIYGDLGVGSPTGFIYCADFTTCTIYNNLLVNTGHVIYGIMWLGQSENFGKNMNVYNNTVVGATAGDVCIMLNISGKAVIENNVCTGPAGIWAFSTYQTSLASFAATISTSNHNVWNIGTGPAWGSQASGNTATYAVWQASGFDAASTTADPKLDSTYHLGSGSPATGFASNLTDLNVNPLDLDLALNPRPPQNNVNWDAGAYNASSGSGPAPPTSLTATVQ
jgi:hypothetical protein